MVLPRALVMRWQAYDWLFLMHVVWSCIAFSLIYDPARSIEQSGTYILEFLIVYLMARVYLVNISQIKATILFLFAMAFISGMVAIPEAFLKERFIHDFAKSLTGISYFFSNETRMGILRAASFFEHPILYGAFCASLLSLIWFISSPLQLLWKIPVIGFATFLSASSAPLMMLIMQIWLLLIERVSRPLKNRLQIIGFMVLALALFMNFASNRGIVGLIATITLKPSTAYARRNIWNFAIDDVMANPIFGFDPSQWTRPYWLGASVDNYWLLISMRSGIPSLIFIFASILLIWVALSRRSNGEVLYENLKTGWGLTMLALLIGGATVAYFGKLQPLFSFYMGLGAALANCAMSSTTSSVKPDRSRVAYNYSRFDHGRSPSPERQTKFVVTVESKINRGTDFVSKDIKQPTYRRSLSKVPK
ncbi:hypothetical protein QCN27_17295 [Cereibacter sp. SYSU M97828]|nr:hypothetical protein [Cereibacter flavus]